MALMSRRGLKSYAIHMLAAAMVLEDLRSPPVNRLEPLHRNRKGQHLIRINDQFRICST